MPRRARRTRPARDRRSPRPPPSPARSWRGLHELGGHQLRSDALGFRRGVIELDLDAVRVKEEELEQRLAVGTPLRELNLLLFEMLQHGAQPGGAERDVIDGASSARASLGSAPEIFLLVLARHPGAG